MNTVETCTITGPDNKTNECAKFIIDDGSFVYTLSDIMMTGRNYTFSCWVKSEAEGNIVVSESVFTSSTEWQYFKHTFTAEDVDLSIGFVTAGTYYVYHAQLELGTIATDWSPAPEDTTDDIISATDDVRTDMAEQNAATLDSCNEMVDEALGSYVERSEYITFKETIATEFEVRDDEISMNFTSIEGKIQEVDGEVQAKFEEINKNISFGDDGISVSDSNGIYSVQVDNVEGVTIRKNGEIRSQLVDDDFYTGNIVIEVNERAQFGIFAYVPRSDGSLSFLKVKDFNFVTTSIDTTGAIYNGTGYKDGYRLNSSGTETASDGKSATGFMPFKVGDTIQTHSFGWDNTTPTTNYIVFYDASFNMLRAVQEGTMRSNIDGSYDINNSGFKFTIPSSIGDTSMTDLAYIRVSGAASGANFVITKNTR